MANDYTLGGGAGTQDSEDGEGRMRVFYGIHYFSEGEVVGRVSEFGTPQNFLDKVRIENPDDYQTVMLEGVARRFVRWYVHPPWECGGEWPDGCYSFCGAGRGAFEVFTFTAGRGLREGE